MFKNFSLAKPPAVLSLNGTPQLVLQHDTVDTHTDETQSGEDDDAQNRNKIGNGAVAGVATRRVMELLGALLRIKISDGRVLVGKFHCFDKHQNVILTDTREYLPLHRTLPGATASAGKKGGAAQKKKKKDAQSKQHTEQPPQQQPQAQPQHRDDEEEAKELWKTGTSRSLGMALVPGKHIVYIKVEQRALDTSMYS